MILITSSGEFSFIILFGILQSVFFFFSFISLLKIIIIIILIIIIIIIIIISHITIFVLSCVALFLLQEYMF